MQFQTTSAAAHGARRRGLGLAAAAALVLPLLAHAATPLDVPIAYLGAADADSLQGARQGVAEGNAQGRFLGLKYQLVEAADVDAALAAHPVALIVDRPAGEIATLAARADGVAVINVGADDDALRAQCRPNLLHTLPSAAMRADAVAQWRKKNPASKASAHAWHWSAEMYAGSQLNKRYADASGRRMSDTAWAGWAAAKVVTDSAARLKSADPAAMLGALRGDLAFDGQKGVDMSFRATGQLRQPLLLVEDDRIVGEAPVRGVSGDLDSLGAGACAP